MKGDPTISSIYRLASDPVEQPEISFSRIWKVCRRLWVQTGTIAIRPEQAPEHIRADLVRWAEAEYGKKANGSHKRRRTQKQ